MLFLVGVNWPYATSKSGSTICGGYAQPHCLVGFLVGANGRGFETKGLESFRICRDIVCSAPTSHSRHSRRSCRRRRQRSFFPDSTDLIPISTPVMIIMVIQMMVATVTLTRWVATVDKKRFLCAKSCNKKAHQLVGQCETRHHSSSIAAPV